MPVENDLLNDLPGKENLKQLEDARSSSKILADRLMMKITVERAGHLN